MSTIAFLSLASMAFASNVLYTLDNVEATVYYDLTESATNDISASSNGGPFSAGWADATINMGITECQNLMSNKMQTLADLGTNRIVAIDHNLIASDPAYWCGRELVLYNSDGSQIEFSEGSFIVWDGCVAAETRNIVDLSALAFVQAKGGTCSGNNPSGLRYEILDNYIWMPTGLPTTPSTTSQSTPLSTSRAASTVSPTTRPLSVSSVNARTDFAMALSTASVTTPAQATTPTSATTASSTTSSSCTYGAWQCDDLAIQVCTYIDLANLDWETVAQCSTICSMTASGSVDCE